MIHYDQCLIATKRLLDAVDEPFWANWIETDIEEWRLHRETSHHRSAYGGMGSFNDIVIARPNHPPAAEEWANELFNWFRSLCFFLVRHPTDSYSGAELFRHLNRSRLSVTAPKQPHPGGHPAAGELSQSHHIFGWQCRNCRKAEVTENSMEGLIARDRLPAMVLNACDTANLESLVDQVLRLEIPALAQARNMLAGAASKSDVLVINRASWNWRCPYCASENTAGRYWKLVDRNGVRFDSPD